MLCRYTHHYISIIENIYFLHQLKNVHPCLVVGPNSFSKYAYINIWRECTAMLCWTSGSNLANIDDLLRIYSTVEDLWKSDIMYVQHDVVNTLSVDIHKVEVQKKLFDQFIPAADTLFGLTLHYQLCYTKKEHNSIALILSIFFSFFLVPIFISIWIKNVLINIHTCPSCMYSMQ